MSIKANIIIDQGTDFVTILNVTDANGAPINLIGFTGYAQMRKHYTSTKFYNFNVSANTANGEVTLSMNSAVSNTIPYGRYVYDCEMRDPNGIMSRLVEGIVTITPQVTKAL